MKHITNLFNPFLTRHHIRDTVHANHVCTVAREVLTLFCHDHMSSLSVRYVKDQTLYIHTSSAALAAELQGYTHDIIQAVNHRCDTNAINTIRIDH